MCGFPGPANEYERRYPASDLRAMPPSTAFANFLLNLRGSITTFFHDLPIIDVDPQRNCCYRLDVENIFTITCPVCCGQAGQDGACSFPTNSPFGSGSGSFFSLRENGQGCRTVCGSCFFLTDSVDAISGVSCGISPLRRLLMFDEKVLQKIQAGKEKWDQGPVAKTLSKSPEAKPVFTTISGTPVERLY